MLLEVSGEQAPVMLCGFPVSLTSGPTKHSNSGEPRRGLAERQDDHGAIAVESRPGCGVARGVPWPPRVYDLMRTRVLPSVKIGRARRAPVSARRAYGDQLTDSW